MIWKFNPLKRFTCEHKYIAYVSVMDKNRRRVIWKCTRCGKEKIGN